MRRPTFPTSWVRARRTGLMPSRLRSGQPLDEECRLGVGGSGTRADGPAGSQHEFVWCTRNIPHGLQASEAVDGTAPGLDTQHSNPTQSLALTAGFPPSADLGSASLLFILSGSGSIKLEPYGPPSHPSLPSSPPMATLEKKLADVEKTSTRSTSLVANEAYIDPKGDETLHRGLNARQVRLPFICSFSPHADHTLPRFP